MGLVRAAFIAVSVSLLTVSCGDGENRPGMVTREGQTGSGTHRGSGTHSGSSSGTAAPAFAEREATTVIEVTTEDHRFVDIPATAKGPRIFFKASTKGSTDHELEVIDADGRRVGKVYALKPGSSGSLAIELQPGTYTVQCLVETGGKPHSQLGMQNKLTVQ
jgi:uncharacterized cupredoxin-like copper-binding protein